MRAVRVAIDRVAIDPYLGIQRTILLDPRPEVRRDALGALVVDALQEAGLRRYGEPGIPPKDVKLLSDVTLRTGQLGTTARVSFSSFGDKQEISFNRYEYALVFSVRCIEGGCVLGDETSAAHGDGFVVAECWEDFFSRTPEDRKWCMAWPRKPGTPGP